LSPTGPGPATGPLAEPTARGAAEDLQTHEVIGGGEQSAAGERLDVIARRYYGDASYWRVLAAFNGIDDPLNIPPGSLLSVPPASRLLERT
jgi:nucleoid-associated protein YgaU